MLHEEGKANFYAFISHKSADAKFALRMQRFIEHYRLPAAVQKATKAPKRLGPLCSYEIDFSGNPLLDEMKNKLQSSRYLIVLCSEALAQGDPKYINYELRTFIEQKRAEGIDPCTRIIPVVLSGTYGRGENDCRPEALKELGENGPIALDCRKFKTEREVFLHVISGMLDIDYAVMENRDKKRRTKVALAIAAVAAVLLMGVAALLDYYLPKKSHYLDFVMKYGVPEGIHSLTAKEYTAMEGHYVITRQCRRIVSLEYVNAYGQRIDHTPGLRAGDRPSAYIFAYTADRLSAVTYEDRFGKTYFTLLYSSPTAADLKDPYNPGVAYQVGSGYVSDPSMLLVDYNTGSHSDITRFVYTYSPEGYVTQVLFYRDSAGNRANDEGIYGLEYTLDDKGRVVEEYYLDALGQRRENPQGIYSKQYAFDDRDNWWQLKHFDSAGQLIANADGVMHLVKEFDDNHRYTRLSFLDAQGELADAPGYGGATQVRQLDSHGYLVRVDVYDPQGNPTQLQGYSAMDYTYDDRGNLLCRTFLNGAGEAVVDPATGYAQVRYGRDAAGNEAEVSFYDLQGNLVDNAHGYARAVKTYNDRGQVTSFAYFTADGSPANFQGFGYHCKRITYDRQGRETSIAYFDGNGTAVNTTGPSYEYGYHRVETIYEYGMYTKFSVVFYDAEGNKVDTLSQSLGATYASADVVVQNGEITHATYSCADGSLYSLLEVETQQNALAETIKTQRSYDGNRKLTYMESHHYRINGVVLRQVKENYGPDEVRAGCEETTYHENGQVQKISIWTFDADGDPVDKISICYREDGTKESASLEEYAKDGSVIDSLTLYYDENGDLVE